MYVVDDVVNMSFDKFLLGQQKHCSSSRDFNSVYAELDN